MSTSITYASTRDSTGEPPEASAVAPSELIAVLNRDYTREIMALIRDEAKPARAIAEACGASRPTVYRRLNRLATAGLVDESMQYERDGHHRKTYRLTVEEFSFTFGESGVAFSASETADTDGRDRPATAGRPSRESTH